jgi:photosystem II stability/assembly factor-like uncharacterized protein
MASADSFVYVGLAGDTGPGYTVRSGLYRSRGGESPWERIDEGLLPAPEVRAIAVHPTHPGTVFVGTQAGVYRSQDQGEHWTRLDAPAPGLAVWSLAFHPRDPDTVLAGYEPAAICRSNDGGASWRSVPLDVTFPDVTVGPAPRPKRVTGIAVDPGRTEELYASIEVGGLLRSLDGGGSWECVTEGLYVVDDAVDLHGVVVSPDRPRTVNIIGRIGMFRSEDGGAHWRHVPVPPLTLRGTYCRTLTVAPDDPATFYLGAGTDFDGDEGVLFRSQDHGRTWRRLDLGAKPRSTLFGVAVDPRAPARLYCASKGGEVFGSRDHGATWRAHPLPTGATQAYALAVG